MNEDIDRVMNLLSKSGIIKPGQLHNLQMRVASDVTLKTVETFTKELVRLGHLTEFQALEVCRGKADQLMLGDYLLIDELGHGSMGQVFRARHAMMNREVAIKMMRPDSMNSFDQVQRFRREVEAVARLNHPNVVSAFDAGEFAGHYFLVMEFVRGQDLRRRVCQAGPQPLNLTLDYVLQAAQGLEYAHERGVIHRDVKPSNLLLADNGVVKVLDLGLSLFSKALDEKFESSLPQTDLTEAGQVMGTVDFMSPEQALHAHDVDPRCDIYSLGCTLHYLLTGQPPYHGESVMSRLVAHRENPIPQLSSKLAKVPPQLDEIFRCMVAKKPIDRFQSMTEVIANLRSCLRDLSDGRECAETVRYRPTGSGKSTSSRAGLWVAGVAALTLSVAALLLRPWEKPLSSDPALNSSALNSSAEISAEQPALDPTAPASPVKEPLPKEIGANVPAVDLTQPFNPLDRMEMAANIVSGVGWKRDGELLLTGIGPATLQLPGATPPEYEFRFVATRQQTAGPLIIGLRLGDHQCYVLLDAARVNGDHVTALGTDSEGKLVSARKGITLESGTPTPVICRVFAAGIDVIVGAETAIEWRGRPSDLRLGGGWRVPDKQALFLGANDGAVFELSDLRVSPLTKSPGSSPEPPR